METLDIGALLDGLDDNIDELEEALAPLLEKALSETAGKFPLLDKAHLYVLVTYAIESLLFSYLRLNGVDAKEHSIYRELARVKQYFEKVKAAGTAGQTSNLKLDKAAASRIIQHALAGNENKNAVKAPQQLTQNSAFDIDGRITSKEKAIKSSSSETNALDENPPAETNGVQAERGKKRKKSRNRGSDPAVPAKVLSGESKQERKRRKKLDKDPALQKKSQEVQRK